MKPKFLSLTSLFGSAIISVLSLATAYESTQAAPSSYQESCDAESFSGCYLQAHCKTSSGGFERASIKLRGIFNIDGRLVQNLLRNDIRFRDTCNSISVVNGVLTARCKKRN